MNFQRNFLSVATVTTLLSLVSALPADAFTFGNSSILFDTDTTVNFEFLQSNGHWYGDFGVKDLSTELETLLISETRNVDPGSGVHNDNLGTVTSIGAVLPEQAFTSFTFNQGTKYSFFLKSYDRTDLGSGTLQNTVYSTSLLNPSRWNTPLTISNNNYDTSLNGRTVNGRDRVLFEGDLFSGLKLFFEDNGIGGDNDYDDFVVSARIAPPVSVPEPTAVVGLGLVTGAMALSRKRKSHPVA